MSEPMAVELGQLLRRYRVQIGLSLWIDARGQLRYHALRADELGPVPLQIIAEEALATIGRTLQSAVVHSQMDGGI